MRLIGRTPPNVLAANLDSIAFSRGTIAFSTGLPVLFDK